MLAKVTAHKREIEMNKLEEFEKKLGSLALELEAMKAEAVQDEEWPKVGCKYWVSQTPPHKPFASIWDGDNTDSFRLATGNVHRTNEEAEAYRVWLTNPRTNARRRVEMCEGFDVAGSFGVVVDSKRVEIYNYVELKNGGLRFAAKGQARACINLLGVDVIKLALGVES